MPRAIHEAAELMPLAEDTLPDLAADIKANGLIDAVELLDGKVIDGRRRLRACEMAGVVPHFKDVTTADPVSYVLSKQNRRDLTPSQRTMIGARAVALREKLSADAKERQREGNARGGSSSGSARRGEPKSVEPVPPTSADPTKTRDQIGKLVGVSGRMVDYGKKVLEKGIPELAKAVDEGRMAVKTAAVLATEPEEVQRAEIANPKRNRTYKSNSGGGEPESELEPEPAAEPTEPVKRSRVSREPLVVDPPPVGAVAAGGYYANAAINVLMRIPRDDPQRVTAGQIVTGWIKKNIKGAR